MESLPDDGCAYRDIELTEDKKLRIKEFSLLEDEAGAVVWDAALVAAHYLAHRAAQGRCLVSGRRVLELGSGTGALGLAAAALGARHVALTDLPHLVPYMRENVQLNGLGATAEAAALVWGDAASLAEARRSWLPAPPHVVLASDVVYTPEGRQALFATLAAVMVPPRSTAAAAARGRAAAEAAAGGGGGGSGRAAAVAGGGGGGSPAEAKAEPGPEDEAAAAGAAAACGSGAAAAQPGPDPAGEPQPGSGGGEGGEGGRGEVADGPGGQGGQGGQREEAEAAAWLCGSGDVVGGSVAVLAFEERPGVEEVPALCEAYGLACVEVEPEELHPDWCCPEIHVLLLQKQRQ
ncbi:hypothetical protein CHLRE_17g747147v5 [Chlamydomonas reinhardtii]|uniref:Uncharacterized protein n=1 Tax=Chlamydomonas reinhardtii TaxID=3055 RepID=A0A2K3CS46_CHLRE|nr:uncharacterized protein CHLRE_17g747147v5 [Chlamydomonas reinhardtii]PNW71113.1 hypothetical protein CHLRE_17g747147v5 [Chlamydomonas reinhardtii]